jgi:hypothetical protein
MAFSIIECICTEVLSIWWIYARTNAALKVMFKQLTVNYLPKCFMPLWKPKFYRHVENSPPLDLHGQFNPVNIFIPYFSVMWFKIIFVKYSN